MFREDLYYRLNVVNIHVPPLRERKEDISLLAAAFLKEISEENGKNILGMSKEVLFGIVQIRLARECTRTAQQHRIGGCYVPR